jgi:hypothetical protein
MRNTMWSFTIFGFALGILLSTAYWLYGSWEWFHPKSDWAQIVFWPGVAAGNFVYQKFHLFTDFDTSVNFCAGIGIFVMGIVGAILGVIANGVAELLGWAFAFCSDRFPSGKKQ